MRDRFERKTTDQPRKADRSAFVDPSAGGCDPADDRLRGDAGGAERFDARVAVALGEAAPVGPDDEGDVAERGRIPAERAGDQDLRRGSGEEIVAAQDTFSQCGVSEPVMGYIAALCEATRDKDRALLGVSPRGMLALLRVSQAYAAIQGRDYVIPDDVKKLAVPVMAHRVILRGLYGKAGENEAFIRELLDKIPAPTETAK